MHFFIFNFNFIIYESRMWFTDLLEMFSKVTGYCSTISYTIDLTYAFIFGTSLSLLTLHFC